MAQPKVFQGSWEDISSHLEEFKGRNDLLLVVPVAKEDSTNGTTAIDGTILRERVERLLEEGEAIERESSKQELTLADALAPLLDKAKYVQREEPMPYTDPYEIAFGEIMKDKYRKMGFKL